LPHQLTQDLRVAQVELALDIAAPRAIVWKALMKHTSEWWRPEFCVSPNPRGIIIEPRVGGRWYEDAGDGAGGLWGVIQTLLPPTTLEVRGDLFHNWGGPAVMHLRLTLDELSPTQTRLNVFDTTFGKISDTLGKRLESGWAVLLGEGLRPFAERLAARKRRAAPAKKGRGGTRPAR
jgi:uncharacterized protein YndB with AHSA1/START domain